jgi:hypothetical protein
MRPHNRREMDFTGLTEADMTRDLPPTVLDWLRHSQEPRARAWRAWVKGTAAQMMEDSARRQILIKKEIDKTEHRGKHIRRIGIVDPVAHRDLQRQFEKGGGSGNWFNDPEFLKDTREKSPQLFVKE